MKKTFSHSDDIEVIEIDYLLCHVHFMQIINCAFKAKKYEVICSHLITALKH